MKINGIHDEASTLAELRRLAEDLLARTTTPARDHELSPADKRVSRFSVACGYAPLAQSMYEARELRSNYFDDDLFGEPAWDILTDLFVHMDRGRQVSVTSACIASRVPPTTALRWVGVLMDRGLIERVPDPVDRRRAFLQLSQPALLKLNSYLKTLVDRGLYL